MRENNVKDYFKDFFRAVHRIVVNWHKNRLTTLSAALSFYSILSLAPLIIIFLNFMRFAFGSDESVQLITSYSANIFGGYSVRIIKAVLTWDLPRESFIISLIAVGLIFYGAMRLLGMMQTSLNEIWSVNIDGKRLHHAIKKELRSFIIIIIAGSSFVILLSFETLMSSLRKSLLSGGGFWLSFLGEIISLLSQLLILMIVFAVLNKALPHRRLNWKDVIPGSIFSAFSLLIGNKILAWYLGRNMMASLYGAASSLVLLLLWAYYVSHIFLIGAEINKQMFKE